MGTLAPAGAPAGALPVPRRGRWRSAGEGLDLGSAGLSGGLGGPLSAAGSPAPSSLDRCVSLAFISGCGTPEGGVAR